MRAAYKCSRCGQPKAGHKCKMLQDRDDGDDDEDDEDSADCSYVTRGSTKRKADPDFDVKELFTGKLEVALNEVMKQCVTKFQASIDSSIANIPIALVSSAKPKAFPGAYVEFMRRIIAETEKHMTACKEEYESEVSAVETEFARAVDKYKEQQKRAASSNVDTEPWAEVSNNSTTSRNEVGPRGATSGAWMEITDVGIVNALSGLNDQTDSAKWTLSYHIKGQSYECEKHADGTMYQTNTQYGTKREVRVGRRPKSPATLKPPVRREITSLEQRIYFDPDFYINLDEDFVHMMLEKYDFNPTKDDSVRVSPELAELALLFDSMGEKVDFVPKYCEIWSRTFALGQFLSMMLDKKCFEVRLVMHGSKTAAYESMRSNPMVFDRARLTAARPGIGHGIYVSCSPHIAYYYRAYRGATDHNVLVGLLLREPADSELVYKHYTLGPTISPPVRYGFSVRDPLDAFCVKESNMLFWFGVACDKPL